MDHNDHNWKARKIPRSQLYYLERSKTFMRS